jgi:hypothetical protein
MITDHARDTIHGIIGSAAPVLGLVTSLQDQIEWGLRITSLAIGIIVGLLSLAKLLKKK